MQPYRDREPNQWAVAVYCAARSTHPQLLALATALGEAIADRGWTLVWGGGNVSAMGVLASAARARGGWTVGVIPRMLVHRELADHDADELIITETMGERKRIMEARADAFIAMPGGIGTLDELLDVWTKGNLRMHEKPVVLLNSHGHYNGLLSWMQDLVNAGYVAQEAMERLVVAGELEIAVAACAPGAKVA
ncbi:MAG: TIGR00730 family Rossman fold protein [Mycobacteriaceae bacterium]|nr:TIGR00730 family Rossman fold protein [Mycobacteriaceae bacterium]